MFSMVEGVHISEMGQLEHNYSLKQLLMDRLELDHVTKVIGYHPTYLEHFLKSQNFIMSGDGPLPFAYRHYLAILAAARHQCTYLVKIYEQEFLEMGGDAKWLLGIEHIPPKLRAIYDINKILAHRPWMLNKNHIEKLTKGTSSWSISEVVHAIVLLAHYHSLSSFVFSCGLTQELDDASSQKYSNNKKPTQPKTVSPAKPLPTDIPALRTSPNINTKIPEVSVEDLMARMKDLSEQNSECSEDELSTRFKRVEEQAAELITAKVAPVVDVPPNISHYINDPGYVYIDFARRGADAAVSTFRIQDYSWDDHGYSLVNRLYNDVGYLLDDKFRCAYNLTYHTMAGRANVDTSKFRRAIWNYIQCIYGIRHDDYDYGEVNQLLDRRLKMFIKTVCCFPERITKKDYDAVLVELQHSEKVHVNLMILEARNQAELLYALREVMRYMT